MKEQPKVTTGEVINMWDHKTWGNNITWFDWEKRKIVGWLMNRPHVGDELRARMASNKIGRFSIVSVEYYKDPHDMFFAVVSDIDYLDE